MNQTRVGSQNCAGDRCNLSEGRSGENAGPSAQGSSLGQDAVDAYRPRSPTGDVQPSGSSGLKRLKGSPIGRASSSVLLIDLEAGVIFEEVGSDGEEILPSDWNQSQFWRKVEEVSASLPSPPILYFSIVDEDLFRTVMLSERGGTILQRLGFSLVDEEENLEAMIGLVGEFKERHDNPTALELWKKDLARDLLAMVHVATHLEVSRLRCAARCRACANSEASWCRKCILNRFEKSD